jgi:pimeloyl-ACP methyl ester carboxylesterase
VYHPINQANEAYPILFLHGHMGDVNYWWQTIEGYKEAMMKIREEGYKNYEGLDENLQIYPGEELSPTYGRPYPRRQIYNAQYYLNQPIDDEHIHGAIGSNGQIIPVNPSDAQAYNNVLSYGSYAQRVADIVNKILEATYSDKILVVAHSMGGLVIRSAIKYYGLGEKVKRLLLIATPNNGVSWKVNSDVSVIDFLILFFLSFIKKVPIVDITEFYDPDWMGKGEVQEIGFTLNNERLTWNWKVGNQTGTWTHFLNQGNWDKWTRIATIAGDLNPVTPAWISLPFPGLGEIKFLDFETSDGLVSVNDVKLDFAVFNSVYRAAHGSSGGVGNDLGWLDIGKIPTWGSNSLTACNYTTEYIKTWVIDGDESRNATSVTPEKVVIFPWPDNIHEHEWDYSVEDLYLSIHIDPQQWDKIIAVRTQFVLDLKNPPECISHTLIWSNKDFSYRDFWQEGNKRKILLYPKKAFGDLSQYQNCDPHKLTGTVYIYSLSGKCYYEYKEIDVRVKNP